MGTWQIVSAIILGAVAITSLIYAYFASREKGPVLSNKWLYASSEERKKIDKSAEYHLVTVIFGTLGTIFLLLTVNILTAWVWVMYVIGVLVAFIIVYAIVDAVKSEKKKK